MFHFDLAIYAIHLVFWGAFGIGRIFCARDPGAYAHSPPMSYSQQRAAAPFSRAVLAVHVLAFATMYYGIGRAVLPRQVPVWFPGQRLVGFIVIAAGAALVLWVLIYFRSWRFRAKLDEGHQLATGGPFGIIRHPIYMGLNLLALGSALWVPTVIVWSAFLLMIIGSDLRARTEEKMLEEIFGSSYRDYAVGKARFLPGIY